MTTETLKQLLPGDVISRFHGPQATELHLLMRPESSPANLYLQVQEAYRKLHATLYLEGQTLGHVVRETVFFRDIDRYVESFARARRQVLQELGSLHTYRPASTFVEQPPLAAGALVEILIATVAPRHERSNQSWNFDHPAACGCDACGKVSVRMVPLGGQVHIHAGNIVGEPGTIYDEAYSMFRSAEEILQCGQADCRSIVRTWIYLRNVERDYAEFNLARREFFRNTGITTPPASTGIGGAPFVLEHNVCLAFHAIRSPRPLEAEQMSAPTLNEAPEYGSDFSRGMRVVDANKVTLYVSGTASVDDKGRTSHKGDFEAQVDRMLLNVSTLLQRQGASFGDVVSATSYLKHAEEAPRLLRIYRQRGIEGIPHALVEADVCRPDLLCELELTALLPRPEGFP